MTKAIDPAVHRSLVALVEGLQALKAEFCIVGALAAELQLEVPPAQLTRDADALVRVSTLDAFEQLKDGLSQRGFSRTPTVFRLRHEEGTIADLLPYSPELAPNGTLSLGDDLHLNVAGFDSAFSSAIELQIAPGLTARVIPLSLFALLKFVAYDDRTALKDLAAILHCCRHYGSQDERRYGLEHDDRPIPFEMTAAYLLGGDGRPFHTGRVLDVLGRVFAQIEHEDRVLVESVAREARGLRLLEERDLAEASDLFRWYRLGAGA